MGDQVPGSFPLFALSLLGLVFCASEEAGSSGWSTGALLLWLHVRGQGHTPSACLSDVVGDEELCCFEGSGRLGWLSMGGSGLVGQGLTFKLVAPVSFRGCPARL